MNHSKIALASTMMLALTSVGANPMPFEISCRDNEDLRAELKQMQIRNDMRPSGIRKPKSKDVAKRRAKNKAARKARKK